MLRACYLVQMAWIIASKGQATEVLPKESIIYVPKGTNYTLAINNSIQTHGDGVDHEVQVLLGIKEEHVQPSRLCSIRLQELKPGFITGIIANSTKEKFQLGKVSFQGMVNKTSSLDKFELHLKLEIEIPAEATLKQPFDEVHLVVRTKRSDHNVGTRKASWLYHLVYIESKPTPNRNTHTNSSSTGQGSTLKSNAFTQASQDPSEEKKNPPEMGPSPKPTRGTLTNSSSTETAYVSDTFNLFYRRSAQDRNESFSKYSIWKGKNITIIALGKEQDNENGSCVTDSVLLDECKQRFSLRYFNKTHLSFRIKNVTLQDAGCYTRVAFFLGMNDPERAKICLFVQEKPSTSTPQLGTTNLSHETSDPSAESGQSDIQFSATILLSLMMVLLVIRMATF